MAISYRCRSKRSVGIARSSAYYRPRQVSAADQNLMRRIDELHPEFPFAGARMLVRLLRRDGYGVGRRRVRTLMKRMGVKALYCKPNTSRRNPQHKIWPYLLRGMKIERANQVFARHNVHSHGARLRLSDGGSGLGESQGSRTPGCNYAGSDTCRGGARRSIRPLRAARHREHRSGLASSRRPRSPMPYLNAACGCRWTAKAPGAITCSSSAYGAASSIRRST